MPFSKARKKNGKHLTLFMLKTVRKEEKKNAMFCG